MLLGAAVVASLGLIRLLLQAANGAWHSSGGGAASTERA